MVTQTRRVSYNSPERRKRHRPLTRVPWTPGHRGSQFKNLGSKAFVLSFGFPPRLLRLLFEISKPLEVWSTPVNICTNVHQFTIPNTTKPCLLVVHVQSGMVPPREPTLRLYLIVVFHFLDTNLLTDFIMQ